MYLLLGNSRMDIRDYEGAIQSFERAQVQMRPHVSQALSVMSLVSSLASISKWLTIFDRYPDGGSMTSTSQFDNVFVKPCIPRVASRRQGSLLNIVNTVGRDAITEPIVIWVSGKLCHFAPPLCIRHVATDLLQRCLSAPESSVHRTPHSPTPTPLLREWAKSNLTGGSWTDALVAVLDVSVFSCSGAPRRFDTPLVRSLQPRDSRFIA